MWAITRRPILIPVVRCTLSHLRLKGVAQLRSTIVPSPPVMEAAINGSFQPIPSIRKIILSSHMNPRRPHRPPRRPTSIRRSPRRKACNWMPPCRRKSSGSTNSRPKSSNWNSNGNWSSNSSRRAIRITTHPRHRAMDRKQLHLSEALPQMKEVQRKICFKH